MRIASALNGALHLVEVCPHDWRFDFPRIAHVARRTHGHAIDHLNAARYSEAVSVLEPLVDAYPEFIDAHDTLALAHARNGQSDDAYKCWKTAVALGVDLFPVDFYLGRDFLIWGFADNRPFLRAYFSLGLEHLRRRLVGEALSVFQNIRYLNPNDSAAGPLIVQCFFRMHRPQDALAFCDRYGSDPSPNMVYGRVLALYQLGRKKEAAAALAEAMRYRPLVAKELIKKTHRAPKDSHPGYIMVGGADEAYHYWRGTGEFWAQTRGAIALVRKALREKETCV